MKVKLVSTIAIAIVLCIGQVVVADQQVQQDDDRGCIPADELQNDVDYFPIKAIPSQSKQWNVSYHNTYKIVQNFATNSSYLLYQCGTDPPSLSSDGLVETDDGDVWNVTDVIEIPVRNIGVGQTVTIPYLDTLGHLDEVVIFMTDVQYVSSPCFLDRIEAGDVLVYADTDAQTDLVTNAGGGSDGGGNESLQELLDGMVAFVGPFSDTPFEHPVEVSAYLETTNGAIYEWIKFYAAFLNEEQIAIDAAAAAADRFQCITDQAARIEADNFDHKPIVLWGSYSDYCGGWNYAKCPNFYCEIASACSVELLYDDPDAGSLELCGGYIYMTTEEFVAHGKDADYWFYSNDNWNDTYALFGEDYLSQFKSVQDIKVYDYQGAGPNKWYEERYGSYYDLVHDFCGIVGTTRELPGQGWFRNVFTEPIGDGGTCTEEGKHSLLPYNFACEPSEFEPVGSSTSGGAAYRVVVVVKVLLFAMSSSIIWLSAIAL